MARMLINTPEVGLIQLTTPSPSISASQEHSYCSCHRRQRLQEGSKSIHDGIQELSILQNDRDRAGHPHDQRTINEAHFVDQAYTNRNKDKDSGHFVDVPFEQNGTCNKGN